jgi:hypothetical protein
LAILEKEVWVTLSSKNMKHYENLGYELPKTKDKRGRLKVPRGKGILVKVEHISSGSNIKVTKICDICDEYIPNRPYYRILKDRSKYNGIDKCKQCISKVTYENSLEHYAINNKKEYLLEEFSTGNEYKPSEIFKGSSKRCWWNCPTCTSEYAMPPKNRTTGRGQNCPYCSGKKVNNINCLANTHPEIAKLLKHKKRGYEITSGSQRKEDFLCKRCGHISNKLIKDTVYHGFSCSKCSDGISYPEKFMISFLDQHEIDYERQKIFNGLENKKYDFYIPALNCIIETNGGQHYIGGFEKLGGRTLQEEQKNDLLKKEFAEKIGIKNYIVIDCSISKLEYIKEKIVKSNLSIFLETKNIDWKKCHEFAIGTIAKEICNLWNDGMKSTYEIGKKLKIHKRTVCQYLKKGAELGWCAYSPIEQRNKVLLTKRPIVRLSLNGEYIEEFESGNEAGRQLRINKRNINSVCQGKRNKAGGYKWMYKEDYEKMLQTT